MIGSLKNGFTATRRWLVEEMFTTAGDTLASIGANDGSACPFTATGSVPAAAGSAQASARARATTRQGERRVRVAGDMAAPFKVRTGPLSDKRQARCPAFSAPPCGPCGTRKIFALAPLQA